MTEVWISAAGLCGSTIIGSILGFLIKELPHKWNDTVLGYCAGIMLAASTIGLIVPAFELAGSAGWWAVSIGVMAGALFLNVLDLITPHLHHLTGLEPEAHANNRSLNHILLFVMAIALHKLPEGMAAGVSMSDTTGGDASWAVSFGIALQNIPEGAAVSLPVRQAGASRAKAFGAGAASGLVEPAGAVLAALLAAPVAGALPWLLSMSAGAMLCATLEELVPAACGRGRAGMAALAVGFAVMMALDVAMG